MNVLKRIIRVMDIAVFAFTTIAICGVFYEGMTLRWYDIVQEKSKQVYTVVYEAKEE